MLEIIEFDWNDEAQLKENLKAWAYNDNLVLLDQDEDLLFHNILWIKQVYDFMLDKTCVKRKYILDIFLEYMRELFLHRSSLAIEQIKNQVILDMVSYCSSTSDKLIRECVDYFYHCERIFKNPQKATLEHTRYIGKLLLNGLTCSAKLSEPIVTATGNYQIASSISSEVIYLQVDSKTGHYKFFGFEKPE